MIDAKKEFVYGSRSLVEDLQHCKRKAYLRVIHGGTGITPVGSNIYLSTGSAVHEGVAVMMRALKKEKIPDVDKAVNTALTLYRQSVTPELLNIVKSDRKEGKEFAYQEQQALIEALTRLWAIKELPTIKRKYYVLTVERDVCNPLGTSGLQFETKVDALLQDRMEGDLLTYSLKTAKGWDSRNEKTYRHDLQGFTEIWGTEQWLKREGVNPNRVTGVKFCYLLKGEWKEMEDYATGEKLGIFQTYNPFIRGYKNLSANAKSIQYAHSWFYHSASNKSGKTTLGKGWTPFFVWQGYKGGVKQWMEDIKGGKIQPNYAESGDPKAIFSDWVITPPMHIRNGNEVTRVMKEVESELLNLYSRTERVKKGVSLEATFPRSRAKCFYPSECEYTAICFGDTYQGGVQLQDAVDSGLYQIRVPHHKEEKRRVEEYVHKAQKSG